MSFDNGEHWGAINLALREQFGEHRRLENAEPDVEAHSDEDEADRKGDAPTPRQELFAGHLAERQHRQVGEE